jgi:hypothetical protein
MGFLNPWLLLGLAGVAVPIVIHLLNRFRRRRIDWAAMELLRRALMMRSRQVRLEDLILLALRCLAIVLIALALARPTIRSSGAKWFGADEQIGGIVAIDGSFSMDARPGVQSRFDRAVARAAEIRKTFRRGDPVSLVLMGNRPRILLRNMAYDERRFDKAATGLAPLPERLDLESSLEQIAALLVEVKAPVREVYLLTDAQAATWAALSDKARRLLQAIAAKAALFVLPTAADSASNLSLNDFRLASGSLRKGTSARYLAEIRNHHTQPQSNVTVTLRLNDNAVDRRTIERIEPGRTESVPLFARFETSGSLRLRAEIDRDPVPADNARQAVARVRDHVRVL